MSIWDNEILDHIKRNKGITLNTKTNVIYDYKGGFMVERERSFIDVDLDINNEMDVVFSFTDLIFRHDKVLRPMNMLVIGYMKDNTNIVHLSIATRFVSIEKAIKHAKETKQSKIYDVKTKEFYIVEEIDKQ